MKYSEKWKDVDSDRKDLKYSVKPKKLSDTIVLTDKLLKKIIKNYER